MVLAGTRWLGIRLDFLSAFLIGAVALFAAFNSQDNAGKFGLLIRVLNKAVSLECIIKQTIIQSRHERLNEPIRSRSKYLCSASRANQRVGTYELVEKFRVKKVAQAFVGNKC